MPGMNIKKWILRIVIGIVLLIIAAAVYIELNKDKLIDILTDEINLAINGQFTHEGGNISILTSFPYINLSLNNVTIADSTVRNTGNSPLFTAERLRFCIDMRTVLRDKDQVRITEVHAEKPDVFLWIDKDGKDNYSIMKERQADTASTSIGLDIEFFGINGLALTYRDDPSHNLLQLANTNLAGHLTYQDERIKIMNQLSGEVSYRGHQAYPALSYQTTGTSAMDLATDGSDIILENIDLLVNDFPVHLSGALHQSGQSYQYEVYFDSPTSEIKKLMSLLPFIYQNKYASIISSGSFSVNGQVSGNTVNDYPLFDMHLVLDKGNISYPDLPRALENLSLKVDAANTSAVTPFTKIMVQDLSVIMGESNIKGDMLLSRSGQNMDVRLNNAMNINLGDFKNALYLPDYKDLKGKMNGNIKVVATVPAPGTASAIKKIDVLEVNVKGDQLSLTRSSDEKQMHVSNVSMQSKVNSVLVNLTGIDYFDQYHMNIEGEILNPVSYIVGSDILRAKANIDASYISLDANDNRNPNTLPLTVPFVDIALTGKIDSLIYMPYDISGLTFSGRLENRQSDFDFLLANFSGSRMSGNTSLQHVLEYGLNGDTLKGTITIREANMDLNRLMADSEKAPPKGTALPIVPGNLDLQIQIDKSQVGYRKIILNSLIGKVNISGSQVSFENNAGLLGGLAIVSGTFDGSQPKTSTIDLNLSLNNLLFSETASKLGFFNTLVPVGDLLEGNYNTTLKWNSALDEAYLPVLSTLTSYGVFETTNGRIRNLLPIDTIMSFIQGISPKAAWEFAATQNWFNIENGRVKIEETRIERGKVRASFSGTHSFAQDLDYQLRIILPKKELRIDKITAIMGQKLAFSDELSALSEELDVELVVSLGGKLKKPKFTIRDVRLAKNGLSESIKETALKTIDTKKQELEKTVKDTLQVIRTKIDSTLSSIKDSAKTRIQAEKELLKNQGKGLLDSLLTGNLDSTLSKGGAILKDKKKSIEDLKKILGKGLPKKKTNN